MEANGTKNVTTYPVDFNVSMCQSDIQKFIYITVSLVTFSVICNMALLVFSFHHKHQSGKSGLGIVSWYVVCQVFYSLLNTMVMLMNQLGHCGWIRQLDAVCKIMWWWKQFTYVGANYILMVIAIFAKSVFLSEKTQLFKKFHISLCVWGILLACGCFVLHYLIITESVDIWTQTGSNIFIASFCRVDSRHTKALEIIEFLFGTIVPCFFELVLFISLSVSALFGKVLQITLPCVSSIDSESTNANEGPASVETPKTTKITSPNFTLCLFVAIVLNVFLVVPQRTIEFLVSVDSNPILLVIGLKNYSHLDGRTWEGITVAFTLLPLVYNIVMAPVYYSLILNDKDIFHVYLCCICKLKKKKSRPLRRQRPIRHHFQDPNAISRCESVESDDRWTDE